MSQVTTNAVPTSPPTAAPASPQAVVDYKPRPAPAPPRLSWLTPRVVLFVLVFGSIVGLPVYLAFDHALNHGMRTRADGVIEVDLKAMSVFPMDQQAGRTEDVPERFRALDGKKVALIGEMYAPNASGQTVGQFDLVYSIAKCCFSGPPQVQHFVKSTPREAGTGMPFYGGMVRVTGTLSVGVQRDAEKVSSVYRLTVDAVEPI
ncbi:MAG TPA: hypothetical protein VF595_05780 [Tepidisphaeraceae bacterium]|jgi:hypothetical protein